MSNSIILFVAILYAYTGVELSVKGQYGLGLTFLAYSISNIGLFLAAKGI